jgi:hypothetical protein
VRERPLEHRAEQGVVAHHHRALPLGRPDPVRRGADQGEVHHGVERVGRGLDHDHADAAPRRRALSGPVDRRGARPSAKPSAPIPYAAKVRASSVSVPP